MFAARLWSWNRGRYGRYGLAEKSSLLLTTVCYSNCRGSTSQLKPLRVKEAEDEMFQKDLLSEAVLRFTQSDIRVSCSVERASLWGTFYLLVFLPGVLNVMRLPIFLYQAPHFLSFGGVFSVLSEKNEQFSCFLTRGPFAKPSSSTSQAVALWISLNRSFDAR